MSTTDSKSSSQDSNESLGEVRIDSHKERRPSEEKRGPQILAPSSSNTVEVNGRRKSVVLETANISDSKLSPSNSTSPTSASSSRRSSILVQRTVGFDAPVSPRHSISPRASLSESPEKKETEKMSETATATAAPPLAKRGSTRINAAAEKLAAMYEKKPDGENPAEGSVSPSGERKAPGKLVMKGPPPMVFGVRPPTEPKSAEQGVDLDKPVLSKGLSQTRLSTARKAGGSVGRRPPSRRTFTPQQSVTDLLAEQNDESSGANEESSEDKEKLEQERKQKLEQEAKEKEEAEAKEKEEQERKEKEDRENKEREEREAKEREEKENKEREEVAKAEAAKAQEEKDRIAKEAQDKLNQEKEEKAQKEKEEKERVKREKEEKAQKEKEEKEAKSLREKEEKEKAKKEKEEKAQKEKEEKETKAQKEKEEKERAKKEKEEKAQKEKEEKEAKVQREKEEKERAKKEKEEKAQREKEEKEAKAKGKAGTVDKDLLAGSPSGKSAGTKSSGANDDSDGSSDSNDEEEEEAPVGSRITGPPANDERKKQLGNRGSMMIADIDGTLQRDFNSLRIKKKPEFEKPDSDEEDGSEDSEDESESEDESDESDSDESESSESSDSESDRPYIPPTNPSVKLPKPTETTPNGSPSQGRHTVEKKRASIAYANSPSVADSTMSPEMEVIKRETLSSMGEYRPLTAEEKALFRGSGDSNTATPVMTMTRGDAKRHASQLGSPGQASSSSRSLGLSFTSPPLSPKSSQSRPTLFWLHPRTHKLEKFRMNKSPLRVGRNSDANEVVIRSKYISRRHCKISTEEIQLEDGPQKVIRISDLESASGTYVNGHRLSKGESKVLAVGDRIRLGKTLIILGDEANKMLFVHGTKEGFGWAKALGGKGNWAKRYFLIDGGVLFTWENNKKKETTFPLGMVDLDGCKVEDEDTILHITQMDSVKFTIKFPNPEEKNEWLDQIRSNS